MAALIMKSFGNFMALKNTNTSNAVTWNYARKTSTYVPTVFNLKSATE
jgi:hypothetical protein